MQSNLDYSHIDSSEKVQKLCSDGELVKMHFLPLNWGGADIVENTIYVPAVVVEQKASLDTIVENLLQEGLKLQYSATPEYKGKSFIASKVVIKVSGDREMEETIDIW